MFIIATFLVALIVSKVRLGQLESLYVLVFFSTGGIQALMVLLFDGDTLASTLGYTNPGLINSMAAKHIDPEILLTSMTLWFFWILVLYIFARISFGRLNVLRTISRYSVSGIEIQGFLLPVSLAYFILSILAKTQDLKILGIALPILSILVAYFLVIIFSFQRRYSLSVWLSIFACLVLVISPSLIFFNRGGILFFLIPVAIVQFFRIKNGEIGFRRIIMPGVFFIVIIFILTIYKYVFGAMSENILEHYSSDSFSLLIFLTEAIGGRLNLSQTMYWYLYDLYYDGGVFSKGIHEAILYPVLQFFPSGLYDYGWVRSVSGIPLEHYLFSAFYGPAAAGGYALPPIVEWAWATTSIMGGFIISGFVYGLVGLLNRGLVVFDERYAILLLTVIWGGFLAPESIAGSLNNFVKYLPISFVILLVLFNLSTLLRPHYKKN